jgi:predicted nucleotidyltransferase
MIDSDSLQQAADLLDQRFGLDTLWLFGSEAEGKAHQGSDLDLAALFRRQPEGLDLFDARTELEEILRRDVDLVDLDHASPILALQVLRRGRLLVDRNPVRRFSFSSRTLSMYEDLKIVRREGEQLLLERISVGQP